MQIPGTLLSAHESSIYSNRLSNLLNAHSGKFVGAQPISFEDKHLELLKEKNYFVSEKADGIRLLMYSCLVNISSPLSPIFAPQMLLIDRKNDYYKINGLGFPKNSSLYLADTIVDGELIYDKTVDGKQILFFLVFDALMVDGKSLVDRPYTSRLGYLRELVLKPYLEKVKKDPGWKKSQPFEIRQKKVEPSYHLERVFEQIKEYRHESDGLIFTSADAAYHFGTCETMIKWKPPSENTVDFLLQVNKTVDGDKFCILISHGAKGYQIESDFEFGSDLEKVKGERLHGRIIECKYDLNWPHYWRFSRFRDDKADANHISTFIKVQKSIQDNVTKEKLLAMRENIANAWKQREAAQKGVKRAHESSFVRKVSEHKIMDSTAHGQKSHHQEKSQEESHHQEKSQEESHHLEKSQEESHHQEKSQEEQGSAKKHKNADKDQQKDKTENRSEQSISERQLLSVDFD